MNPPNKWCCAQAQSPRNCCLVFCDEPFNDSYVALTSAACSAFVFLAWASASFSVSAMPSSPWAWASASWVQTKRKEATNNRKQHETKRNNSSSTMSNLFEARKCWNRFYFTKRQRSSCQCGTSRDQMRFNRFVDTHPRPRTFYFPGI